MSSDNAVIERYAKAAENREDALCCPVSYDPILLKLLPPEIIEKDYGCGDPSRYVRPGDIVLDLGSGSGKVCYIAAQLVGKRGRVIGVDMNDAMLVLARKYQEEMADKLGQDRVRFVKGMIQDLALDIEATEEYLSKYPVTTAAELNALQAWQAEQRRQRPLVPDSSVDVVISNCVLNLVGETDREQLLTEIFRVLKPGGRVAISDIVCDEPVPDELRADSELWSGCISGAFQESAFMQAFLKAGFLAVAYDKWDARPWRVVDGIEFRSVTLTAIKGSGVACMDSGHAVIYRGPYASVNDDEGHTYYRGERMAVCERTYQLLTKEDPYQADFIGIPPASSRIPVAWCAPNGTRRPAAESKGADHTNSRAEPGCC